MLDIDNVCSLSVSLFLSVNIDSKDVIHVSMENCSESNQMDLGFCKGNQNTSAILKYKHIVNGQLSKYIIYPYVNSTIVFVVCTRQYLVILSID